jgi:hypothetical protein
MTSRPWHIVRWFGFLAVGAAIAIGSGMRFCAKDSPTDAFDGKFEPAKNSLVAEAPRTWLAPETFDDPSAGGVSGPEALAGVEDSARAPLENAPPSALDPSSPEAERQIAELGAALAGFEAENVQVRMIEDRGSRRFVFSCDVPTGGGAESFVGEGPDPPSAARHALSRIRAWAAAPGETTLR